MTVTDSPATADGADEGMLAWLMSVAEQTRPADDVAPAVIPVAWMGRTSTDDQQDPTLSLPRQLETCRAALPAQFVIVAKFYDVESGRNDLDLRGHGDKHERLDISIARDGGIADLLKESKRRDRRFVAVICESIERVARLSYFSTKIEYELGQAGVVLLAADEGVDAARVLPRAGGARPKQATQVLTRRIKQAISEWYVLNMLELSWDGFREHTRQGWNIGKPPYGYAAERHPHPVKAKRDDGKAKTRLIPDPVRGPVVTQIFQWRALEQLSAQDIADRLNLDPERFPPPEPIPGEGRRAVGAWTKTSVRDLLSNPKYTGYMVWNRRKRSRPERRVSGRVNPPSEWVWSRQPTHEPLATRALFDAATPVARIREGSRGGAGPNSAHPHTRRSYVLRSYVICDLCGRRMFGKTRRRRDHEHTYYACVTNREHHREQPWYAEHPKSALVREDLILPVVGQFFTERVLGPGRQLFLRSADDHVPPPPAKDDAQRTALAARVEQLTRAQTNLMAQLEDYAPTGDDEIDGEWRAMLQRRFAAVTAERNAARSQLAALKTPSVPAPARPADELALLAALPCTPTDLTLLPEEDQRQLYDAFHLQVRYNRAKHQLTLRVTINAATVDALAAAVAAAVDDTHHADGVTGPPTAGIAPSGSHAGRILPGAPSLTRAFVTALRSPASIVEQVVEQGSLT
jgi:site-specific DNA recombinase